MQKFFINAVFFLLTFACFIKESKESALVARLSMLMQYIENNYHTTKLSFSVCQTLSFSHVRTFLSKLFMPRLKHIKSEKYKMSFYTCYDMRKKRQIQQLQLKKAPNSNSRYLDLPVKIKVDQYKISILDLLDVKSD